MLQCPVSNAKGKNILCAWPGSFNQIRASATESSSHSHTPGHPNIPACSLTLQPLQQLATNDKNRSQRGSRSGYNRATPEQTGTMLLCVLKLPCLTGNGEGTILLVKVSIPAYLPLSNTHSSFILFFKVDLH